MPAYRDWIYHPTDGEHMEKNKIMAIVAAAMLVTVAAIGVIWYLNSDDGDGFEPGILLFHDTDDYEFVPMDTKGMNASTAFYAALGIEPPAEVLAASSEDITDWELWAIRKNGSEWIRLDLVNNPADVIVSEYDAVSWSLIGEPTIPADASMIRLFSVIDDYNNIVCLSASITEITAALVNVDRIIATDSWSDFPKSVADGKEAGTIKDVGSYWNGINFELIVESGSDLVIMDRDAHGQIEVANALKNAGINVLLLSGHQGSLDEVYQNILTVGLVTKTMSKANELVNENKRITDELIGLVSDGGFEGKKIMVMMPPEQTNAIIAGKWGVVGSAIMTLGLEVALGLEISWTPWPGISTETVLNDGGDTYVVILMANWAGLTYGDLAAHDVLGGIPAIQEGRVCILTEPSRADDIISRAGPSVVHMLGILCYLATFDWSGTSGGVTMGDDYMNYLNTLGVF